METNGNFCILYNMFQIPFFKTFISPLVEKKEPNSSWSWRSDISLTYHDVPLHYGCGRRALLIHIALGTIIRIKLEQRQLQRQAVEQKSPSDFIVGWQRSKQPGCYPHFLQVMRGCAAVGPSASGSSDIASQDLPCIDTKIALIYRKLPQKRTKQYILHMVRCIKICAPNGTLWLFRRGDFSHLSV